MQFQCCFNASEDKFPLPPNLKQLYGPFGFPEPRDARRPHDFQLRNEPRWPGCLPRDRRPGRWSRDIPQPGGSLADGLPARSS